MMLQFYTLTTISVGIPSKVDKVEMSQYQFEKRMLLISIFLNKNFLVKNRVVQVN